MCDCGKLLHLHHILIHSAKHMKCSYLNVVLLSSFIINCSFSDCPSIMATSKDFHLTKTEGRESGKINSRAMFFYFMNPFLFVIPYIICLLSWMWYNARQIKAIPTFFLYLSYINTNFVFNNFFFSYCHTWRCFHWWRSCKYVVNLNKIIMTGF